MSTDSVIYLGMDDGHRDAKGTLSTGHRITIPSSAMSGLSKRISINGTKSRVFSYETADGQFSLGDIENAEDNAFDEYPYSAQNRAIVAHAMRVAGLDHTHQVVLVSGLPLKRFYLKGEPNKALIKLKKANLLRNDVVGLDGYKPPKIIRHDVLSEAIAGWVDYVIYRDESGRLVMDNDRVAQRTAIIDIGGRTTDIAVVKGWDLDFARSTTEDVGMITIVNAVKDSLYDVFDGNEPTDEQVKMAIDTGSVMFYGQPIDVQSLVNSAVVTTVNSLKSTIKAKLKNPHDIQSVRFIGGTSKFIESHIQDWFKNQIMAENAVHANADGMAKYAEFVMGTRK